MSDMTFSPRPNRWTSKWNHSPKEKHCCSLIWHVLWTDTTYLSPFSAMYTTYVMLVSHIFPNIWNKSKVIARLWDHDSMSRALIGLHWLPGDKRIEYKLLLYTYTALHDLAPGYLCELVVKYVPRRVLRSAELNLLTVPPGKPGKYGSRSFARASANLWNSLRGERAAWLKNSPTLESFKRNLKTFLFWERFSS